MSQVSFRTHYQGIPVLVMAGWDAPLQYYHFTVFDERADADEECIFSCLDIKEPFQKKLDRWKNILNDMKIAAPEGFWERAERKENGDHLYYYSEGKWNR